MYHNIRNCINALSRLYSFNYAQDSQELVEIIDNAVDAVNELYELALSYPHFSALEQSLSMDKVKLLIRPSFSLILPLTYTSHVACWHKFMECKSNLRLLQPRSDFRSFFGTDLKYCQIRRYRPFHFQRNYC